MIGVLLENIEPLYVANSKQLDANIHKPLTRKYVITKINF